MADHLLTTKELSQLLSVTAAWLNQAAASGDIPAYRVGTQWRFDANELGLWLTLNGNDATRLGPRRGILPPPIPGHANPPPTPIVDIERTTSAADVAGELGVQVGSVRAWISEGILPGIHVGRSWLVDTASYEGWKTILTDGREQPVRGDSRRVREAVLSNLLRRMGIDYTPGSWQRHGGKLPTWAEAVVDPRRHHLGD